jgi:alpha-tubulin suppressor-like RCC1 family protein
MADCLKPERRVPTNPDSLPASSAFLKSVSKLFQSNFFAGTSRTNHPSLSWGTNAQLQLGNGTSTSTNQPVFVSNLTNAIKIVAGGLHSVALTAAGEVWSWGNGGDGEMGNGANSSSSVPVKAVYLSNIVDIAAASYHTLALKADETVWAWGYNHEGELGMGNTNNTNVPTLVSSPYSGLEDRRVSLNTYARVIGSSRGNEAPIEIKSDRMSSKAADPARP